MRREVAGIGLRRREDWLELLDYEGEVMLRPFFCYYGGKWRSALKYPTPKYKQIIEPFAGAAGYSLRYAAHDVTLCELDETIAALWRYLIKVRSSEILALPDVIESVDEIKCAEARSLIGFWLNKGVSSPRRSPSKWMRSGVRPGSFWGDRVRQTIAAQLKYIRHWKIVCGSYEQLENMKATWFVDPPYQLAGKFYRCCRVDFVALRRWCLNRNGQITVCENLGADWLPFKPLGSFKNTTGTRSAEVIWTNT